MSADQGQGEFDDDEETPASRYHSIREEVGNVLVGYEDVVEQLTITLLTGGHVLLEGVPGIAKTTLARSFARSTGLEFNRIQMTPDLLPADITGTAIYRENLGEFEVRMGPIFANVVLVDEINRATPKTQSALLEAMQEGSVTIDGDTYDLPDPFFVIATQNPIEMEGVYELPEAQRDRFQCKVTMDLPDRDVERSMLDQFDDEPSLDPSEIAPTVTDDDIAAARESVGAVHVSDPVKEYILDLVSSTRADPDIQHGASPRATLAFLSASKARAAMRGRDYVIPDDVKWLASAVLSHRIVLHTDADLGGVTREDCIERIVESVDPPSQEVTNDLVSTTDSETSGE